MNEDLKKKLRVDGENKSTYVTIFGLGENDIVSLVANIDEDQSDLWLKWRNQYKKSINRSIVSKLKERYPDDYTPSMQEVTLFISSMVE